MDLNHTFTAERPVARHCPEILRSGPSPLELVPSLERFGDRFARIFGASLSRLWGDATVKVGRNPARECTMANLADEIAPLAANSLLNAGAPEAHILASVQAEAILRLVDRAFGGTGKAPTILPEAFPMSAELMIARLEAMIVSSVSRALDAKSDDKVSAARRDGSLTQLTPLGKSTPLVVLTLEIEEVDREPWHVTLAFPPETMDGLFSQGEQERAPKAARAGSADPSNEPFGEMPLTLSAVLVDMRLPFSSLSALKPGQILPVAVARNVPLKIGDKTIAHGTVGEMDDRVAIQITQAF